MVFVSPRILISRVSYSGNTVASQATDGSPILPTRSNIKKCVVKNAFFDMIMKYFAALAQLVEQHFRKVKVPSSTLGGGSTSIN